MEAQLLRKLIEEINGMKGNLDAAFVNSSEAAGDLAELSADIDGKEERDEKIKQLEDSCKEYLDAQKLHDIESEILKTLLTTAQSIEGKRHRKQPLDESELHFMPGGKPFLEFFKANVDDQLESYDELPEAEKYGNNGTFVKFHQRIWEAQNPGKQFDRRRMFGQSTGNEEESDEDIEMVAVQENIRCPLSGQVMTEPYTSRVCNHSYSPAIIEYINQCSGDRRDAECPFPGCNHIVSLDNLAKNKPLARKIAKIQATMSSTQGNEDYSIDDDEE